MAWSVEHIPDQTGRVAVVTGANGGLGLVTARALARAGAHVVMAARDQDKAAAARREVMAAAPGASVEVRELDLASLDAVRACAEAIVDDHEHVDLLVNNAGVMAVPEQATADGFELQLGVNHLGHFVLTRHLLPALLRGSDARVISVTSFARFTGTPVRGSNPHLHGRYGPWRAYGQSKLANLHFAVTLDERLVAAGAPVRSLAAHPGLSNTDLQARSVRATGGGFGQRFWHVTARAVGMPPERGALPQLRAATDPDAQGGDLFAPAWGSFGPPVRHPLVEPMLRRRARTTLWEVSEQETGERFDVAAIVRAAASG